MQHSHPLPIKFTAQAQLDYFDILHYTEEQFGSQQVVIYEEWIHSAIEKVALCPTLGQAISTSGYYRYHISRSGNRGSHYLYYGIFDDVLVIVRILHEKRLYANANPFKAGI